jgi:hypothetical protein
MFWTPQPSIWSVLPIAGVQYDHNKPIAFGTAEHSEVWARALREHKTINATSSRNLIVDLHKLLRNVSNTQRESA